MANVQPKSTIWDTVSFWLATWFGAGLSPWAPGTMGALAALPLHFGLLNLPRPVHLSVIVGLSVAGGYCAQQVARMRGQDDPQIVVIDESAGVLLALWAAGSGAHWLALGAAFVGFRLLDIWKPWPISLLERLRPAGLGIMADDIAAGLVAGYTVYFVFSVLPAVAQ